MQRCNQAVCTVDNELIGQIEKGLVIFIGFKKEDSVKDMEYILDKVIGLRVFEDEQEKMNLSLCDTDGHLLIIPNFTLYGDVRKGKRPSFSTAERPIKAEKLFEDFVELAKNKFIGKIATGKFQGDMKINVSNDGPVTILLDSERGF